jgi:hypothetical protein
LIANPDLGPPLREGAASRTSSKLAAVNIAVLLTLPFAGVCSFMFGGLFAADYVHSDPSLFPSLRRGIESSNLVSIACLALIGWLAGRFSAVPALAIGLVTLCLLPVVSSLEMRLSLGSHNVWPLEWLAYGVCAFIPTAGAAFGRWKRRNAVDAI